MALENRLTASKLHCRLVPITRVNQNCSLVWCADTRLGAVVDPGGDSHKIQRAIEEENVTVEKLLVTHGHGDHGGGANQLSNALNVPVFGPHIGDEALVENMKNMGELYGIEAESYRPQAWFEDQDAIQIGNQTLTALHCPGHTPGSIVYFSEEARIAFVGDILFKGAIGHTKTPLNHLELLKTIRLKLFPLGDDVLFVPGHNELSTFGEERKNNRVVSDDAAKEYEHYFTDPRFQT